MDVKYCDGVRSRVHRKQQRVFRVGNHILIRIERPQLQRRVENTGSACEKWRSGQGRQVALTVAPKGEDGIPARSTNIALNVNDPGGSFIRIVPFFGK